MNRKPIHTELYGLLFVYNQVVVIYGFFVLCLVLCAKLVSRIYFVKIHLNMDYVRDGEIQGQCTYKKTKERLSISPSLT